MKTESSRNQAVTITTVSIIVAEAKNNPVSERITIYIVNTSLAGQIISLAVDGEAVLNQGITMQPGGFYQESNDSGFKATQKRIEGISSAAGGTLSIYERVAHNGI